LKILLIFEMETLPQVRGWHPLIDLNSDHGGRRGCNGSIGQRPSISAIYPLFLDYPRRLDSIFHIFIWPDDLSEIFDF
jgi:hypothetical protein